MSAPSSTDGMPPLALLAGGLATRLQPATATVPKSLMMVAGEPFIAHQLRLLAGQDVRDVVICCGHMGDQIESFVGDGSRFGCKVRYSGDGPKPLGTGGAIRQALPILGPHFWVMYGDSYLPTAVGPIWKSFCSLRKPALMTVFANANHWDFSNVEFAERRITRYDKVECNSEMKHIDYGLGLFSADVFYRWTGPDVFDLSTLQRQLVEQHEMAGYEVAERFYEIGSIAGLAETDAFLRARLQVNDAEAIGARP